MQDDDLNITEQLLFYHDKGKIKNFDYVFLLDKMKNKNICFCLHNFNNELLMEFSFCFKKM